MIDDRHRLAQILDELELVRGEHDRDAAGRLLAQDVDHHVGRDGIKPRERFIEDQ